MVVCPADVHMEVTPDQHVQLKPGQPVNGCIPSADVLFSSLSRTPGGRALGLVLTGMGRDGASGLAAMREHGCITAAQDEQSSVVYGMPRAAASSGAAMYEVGLHDMARFLKKVAGV
jgi:two-component system chemotaxis response regulator CheB